MLLYGKAYCQRLQDHWIHQDEVQYWCVVWNQLY